MSIETLSQPNLPLPDAKKCHKTGLNHCPRHFGLTPVPQYPSLKVYDIGSQIPRENLKLYLINPECYRNLVVHYIFCDFHVSAMIILAYSMSWLLCIIYINMLMWPSLAKTLWCNIYVWSWSIKQKCPPPEDSST